MDKILYKAIRFKLGNEMGKSFGLERSNETKLSNKVKHNRVNENAQNGMPTLWGEPETVLTGD
ncbi:MAG: hypothetical protein WC942_11415 [Clostridia bacterium]|jgi:hypothetical protein